MKAGVAHPALYTHPMIGTFPGVSKRRIIHAKLKYIFFSMNIIHRSLVPPVQPVVAIPFLERL
jgi:hypothetical protein